MIYLLLYFTLIIISHILTGDVVFELIRSMSQAEKRYFKRYATLHSEKRASKYVRLFELLGKQKKYDREALEHILKPTHFAQDKRHLYTKILESLTAFRRGGSINDQIGTMVSYHTILRQKGIQPFAAKELNVVQNKKFKVTILAAKTWQTTVMQCFEKKTGKLFCG